jgi:outer membrane lipoprotein carrier protein
VKLLLMAIIALLATPANAQDPAEIAGRASRAYRAFGAIRANFHQVIEDRMLGTQESRGELVQSGNAHLVMRFTDPKGDRIVLDGTWLWLYTPSTTPGQVIRTPIPSDPVYGPNVLARILDKPAERYEIEWLGIDSVEHRAVDVLEFIPTSADPLFSRAVISLDRQTLVPRRLALDERSGVRRTLTLSRIRTNVAVPKSEFTFTVPDGVRVIER